MRNDNIRRVKRRDNFLYKLVFGVAYYWSSYPKLLLEVFIRKNFGRRYFNFGLNLFILIVLAGWPKLRSYFRLHEDLNWYYKKYYNHDVVYHYWFPYLTWYIFLALFLIFSFVRWVEILRQPKEFTLKTRSNYSGDISTFFWTFGRPETKRIIKVGNLTDEELNKLKYNSTRFIESVLEPFPFFILGLILYFLNQNLGVLLITCSLFYSFGSYGSYMLVEEEIQDRMDDMQGTEVMSSALNSIRKKAGVHTASREVIEPDIQKEDRDAPIKVS